MVPRSSASAPLPPLWGARGVRIYSSARVRIRQPPPRPFPRYAAPSRSRRGLFIPLRQDPNPHPLPRYAAPSHSRRGLEMYLG